MERKINGKPVETLFSSVPQDRVKTFETAKRTFESFVGDNYEVGYNDLSIVTVGTLLYVTVKVTVTLIDDYGNKLSRDYITSNEIGVKDDKPINLSVTIDRAEKEAFRRCVCTFFMNVTDSSKQVASQSGNGGNAGAGSRYQSQQQSHEKSSDSLEVQLQTELEPIPGYNETFRCYGVCNDEKVQVMFWYGTTKKLKTIGYWERVVSASKNHSTITITAKKERYKENTQLSVTEVYF